MKQIDVFVDSVYHGLGGNEVEIQELKAEMKSHLVEAVHELRTEGKTEQEAIEIAIQRFGGEKEMRSIVGQLFKAQKNFAKWVLILAMMFLIICGTLLTGAVIKETKMVGVQNITFSKIAAMVENEENLTPALTNEIEFLVEQNKYSIKSIKITDRRTGEDVFEYKNQIVGPKWLYSYEDNGSIRDKLFLSMETQRFDDFLFIGLLAGIAIYWTLFTIWATINAYHHRRLNIGWIIAFALLNVFGYLAYFVFGKRVKKTTN
ncbi:permease prefix domain 1-containing protein [Mesobacillus jeotgali]|uniref:permease prefix domain 1-containing protein n=1 Tax=Mesobacillus jeotgali TaxID=129985 RepID=UPI000C858239|nr:permease prefix domain 1-containing protein [Mesobacillus jeotgali]